MFHSITPEQWFTLSVLVVVCAVMMYTGLHFKRKEEREAGEASR